MYEYIGKIKIITAKDSTTQRISSRSVLVLMLFRDVVELSRMFYLIFDI